MPYHLLHAPTFTDSNGRLAKTTFGNPRTRTVSYTHTTRGDLATITSADYTQTLAYSGDSCHNGNIRTSSWKGSDGIDRSYRFTYDGMNRLTRALYSESGRKEHPLGLVKTEGTPDYTETMSYDLWSNPVRIRRHGITEVPATASRGTLRFGLCDDITLTYSGDRLVRADDTAPEVRFSGATDFLDGASKSAEYTYDAAGNMLTDANRGIGAVTYNRLHRPETVGINGDTFGFIYSSAGTLLQRTHHHPFGSLNPLGGLMPLTAGLDPGPPVFDSMTDTVSYCGPFEYSNGSLSRVNFPGGYVSGGVAYHYIHDHQGNVRQVVDATTGKVVQESHYYPGGMLFAESTATYFKPGSANNTYRYCGKELLTDAGLNLSLHGARMYDPALLRFITPDPLRHETPHLSSYLYCAANPVMLVDPTGMRLNYLGSEDERELMMVYIDALRSNKLFALYFQEIDNSNVDYYIGFNNTTFNDNSCPGYYDSNSKTISINGNSEEFEQFAAIVEETFHIFQEITATQHSESAKSNYKWENNIEYEAKAVTQLVVNDTRNNGVPEYDKSLPPGFSFGSGFIKTCLSGDSNSPYLSYLDIRGIPYKTLNDEYVAGGREFYLGQPHNQPPEYLVNKFYLSNTLYNLLYNASN